MPLEFNRGKKSIPDETWLSSKQWSRILGLREITVLEAIDKGGVGFMIGYRPDIPSYYLIGVQIAETPKLIAGVNQISRKWCGLPLDDNFILRIGKDRFVEYRYPKVAYGFFQQP